ncbi:MAG: RNA-binding transcriptional accessory protein [Pirellulaceae bacterium]|nr:MAG: RNA-binding transcriptional accessory protein [Pirellulaceae bacterium]
MNSVVQIDPVQLARQLRLGTEQVQRTLDLLDDGNTIPFITRYRKDQTGGLDEEQIRAVARLAVRLRAVAERKQTILKSLQAQGKLTPELQSAILAAESLKQLEDLYLPYKPRKQTLAILARQRGLVPLFEKIWSSTEKTEELEQLAAPYVHPDKGLKSAADVLQGVRHLMAERFSESAELRRTLRRTLWKHGVLVSQRAESPKAQEAVVARENSHSQAGSPAGDTTGPPSDLKAGGDPNTGGEAAPVTEVSGETAPGAGEASPPWPETVANADASKTARRQQREQRKEAKRRKLQAAFKDYFDFCEPLRRMPPHRILAINRGERARILRVKIEVEFERVWQVAQRVAVPPEHPFRDLLLAALRDALQRLILPALEREIRRELTERAEQHAVEVFARNLRKLLLQPPVRGRRVAAIDPGFRSGCKIVALDECGNVLGHDLVHLIGGEEKRHEARRRLSQLVRSHGISVIAIGNGAASRQTEQFVAETLEQELRDLDVAYVIVNEAGASVYSTSPLGREELPEYDPQLRSAISIGRRLLDPLSELVKIHPANLGVGLYQHDIKAKHLYASLDEVVESCVNYVGVDVNTASVALLRYVSGLNQLTARRIVEYRSQHGPFRSREELKNVPGLGEATFIQAAGFLRVHGGTNPLDTTWIHPESYHLAERILERLGASVEWLRPASSAASSIPEPSGIHAETNDRSAARQDDTGSPDRQSGIDRAKATGTGNGPPRTNLRAELAERIGRVDPRQLAAELGAGEHLVRDILAALSSPPRDPREDLPPPIFRRGILKLDDLKPGMELTGTVLNVVDFGAFVDIGLVDCGLVHISRLADRFIRDPHEVVGVGDILKVWVVEVDRDRRHVSLTAIAPGTATREKPAQRRSGGTGSRPQKEAASPTPERPAAVETAQPSGAAQPCRPTRTAAQTVESQEAQDQKSAAAYSGKPRESHTRDSVRPADSVKPARRGRPASATAVVLNQAKQEGREPLRSFAELLEFYKQRHAQP